MAQGPILIFDKSTLQALNPDQANWLDNFFMSNITPLFYIETLADLEKEVKAGKTPEQVVGEIAYKTPDMQGHPNLYHLTLIWGELMGKGEIVMEGYPVVGGGKPVMYEGATGIIYKQSPEEEAFNRWKHGEFLEVERGIAARWRQEVESLDLKAMAASFKGIHQAAGRPTRLEDIKALADAIIDGPDQEAVLRMGLAFTISDENWGNQIVVRWQSLGQPKIREYAPYFTHVLTVDLFFCLGMAASQIGSERKSNKVDIAYLYYLPFCMVFTSRDDLHVRSVPLFLRADQSFVHGDALKADLKRLDEYYDALPEETKKQSIYSFAAYPPNDDSYLVTQLWKKHLRPPEGYEQRPPKYEGKTIYVPPAGSDPKEIIKALDDFEANAVPLGPETPVAMDEAAVVQFSKFVMRTKGKWIRVPEKSGD
jgi:hypothetical protein